MARTSFLADFHERFGLAPQQAAAIVQDALGRDVVESSRLARGYDNEVYRVRLINGRVVYLRIRPDGGGTYQQEAEAMSLARGVGVRVPELLALSASCDRADGRPIMVVAEASGRQIAAGIAEGSDRIDARLLASLGEQLALLHTISMPGVWRPDDQDGWPSPESVRQGFGAERRQEADQLIAAGMTSDEVESVMSLIDVSPDPPLSNFVLCHGDISPEHVFADSDLGVSDIIDWGMWHAGSRLGELATVASTFGWPALPSVLAAYGSTLAADEIRNQIATVQAVQLIGHVAHHIRIGDVEGAAQSIEATKQALRVLDGWND